MRKTNTNYTYEYDGEEVGIDIKEEGSDFLKVSQR
jgi:hypothetical protein